jgi:hypothetical protein
VTVGVLANDYDPDGQAISIQSCAQPGYGTASISGSSVIYTSTNTWAGADNFTYTIQDTMGATASATVTVTVAADVTPPVLLSAACRGDSNVVTATFNEKVQPGSGANGAENPTNYGIDHGVTISAALLQGDGRKVKLTTSAIADGTNYTLTVNNVGDLATPANVIAPNSQATFAYSPMVPGLAYEYYHGSWASGGYLPDFGSLTPVSNGVVSTFSLAPRLKDTDFAFRYAGKIEIATNGTYTFYTYSDDGSELYIDGRRIVNNDGPHGVTEQSGATNLAAGFHDIVATYCQGGGEFGLTVSWAGPGITKQEISSNVLYHVNTPDANGDGLPDAWQAAYFGNANSTNAAPEADPDHDGMNNRQEWRAGTNPTNAVSVLKFVSIANVLNGIGFDFQTVSGRWYTVEWNTNLLGTDWAEYLNFLGTADAPASVTFTNPVPAAFFRVKVSP